MQTNLESNDSLKITILTLKEKLKKLLPALKNTLNNSEQVKKILATSQTVNLDNCIEKFKSLITKIEAHINIANDESSMSLLATLQSYEIEITITANQLHNYVLDLKLDLKSNKAYQNQPDNFSSNMIDQLKIKVINLQNELKKSEKFLEALLKQCEIFKNNFSQKSDTQSYEDMTRIIKKIHIINTLINLKISQNGKKKYHAELLKFLDTTTAQVNHWKKLFPDLLEKNEKFVVMESQNIDQENGKTEIISAENSNSDIAKIMVELQTPRINSNGLYPQLITSLKEVSTNQENADLSTKRKTNSTAILHSSDFFQYKKNETTNYKVEDIQFSRKRSKNF